MESDSEDELSSSLSLFDPSDDDFFAFAFAAFFAFFYSNLACFLSNLVVTLTGEKQSSSSVCKVVTLASFFFVNSKFVSGNFDNAFWSKGLFCSHLVLGRATLVSICRSLFKAEASVFGTNEI